MFLFFFFSFFFFKKKHTHTKTNNNNNNKTKKKNMGVTAVLNGSAFGLGLWCQSTLIVGIQFLFLLVWPVSKKMYYYFQAHIMRQWAQNLFFMMRLFAPGDLIITIDESCTKDERGIDEEEDAEEELERLLTRNKKGEVIGISFPDKLIMMANHQVRKKKKKMKNVWAEPIYYIDISGLDLRLVFGLFI